MKCLNIKNKRTSFIFTHFSPLSKTKIFILGRKCWRNIYRIIWGKCNPSSSPNQPKKGNLGPLNTTWIRFCTWIIINMTPWKSSFCREINFFHKWWGVRGPNLHKRTNFYVLEEITKIHWKIKQIDILKNIKNKGSKYKFYKTAALK